MSDLTVDLEGQVALVTGGGGGIGRGIALSLAVAGADIVLAEIDAQRAEQTADLIRDRGRKVLAVQTDVMDTDQVRAAVDRADADSGGWISSSTMPAVCAAVRSSIRVNAAGGDTSTSISSACLPRPPLLFP